MSSTCYLNDKNIFKTVIINLIVSVICFPCIDVLGFVKSIGKVEEYQSQGEDKCYMCMVLFDAHKFMNI